ncbi:Histone-lysine N-methyltransferase SETMAR [Eumeta japonica]|uniref:Histone-lysine N-methyltransferase SETMAR n=1 Tax=Eumeta variegata TaxID=151549 RepID=A0A4C1SWB5_EUMVA|nr:Histone-lysine N-methyltransferase SETMAR [Eumeta japonica]
MPRLTGPPLLWLQFEVGFELLEHPPYSPDLAPYDFYLLLRLKEYLNERRFEDDGAVAAAIQDFFGAQVTDGGAGAAALSATIGGVKGIVIVTTPDFNVKNVNIVNVTIVTKYLTSLEGQRFDYDYEAKPARSSSNEFERTALRAAGQRRHVAVMTRCLNTTTAQWLRTSLVSSQKVVGFGTQTVRLVNDPLVKSNQAIDATPPYSKSVFSYRSQTSATSSDQRWGLKVQAPRYRMKRS